MAAMAAIFDFCICYVRVNSSREHPPPGQTPGHTPGI